VSARRYLADVAAAAEAVRDFGSVLSEVAGDPTPARLSRVAPRLEEPLRRARLLARRLSAEGLADERLEAQRARAAPRYAAAADAMGDLVEAARRGEAGAAARASARLARAVRELREVGTAPAG